MCWSSCLCLFSHVLWLFSPHLLVSPLSSYSCVLVGSPASFLPTLIASFFFASCLQCAKIHQATLFLVLFGILIHSSWTCDLSLNFGWTFHTKCLWLMTQACPLHKTQRFNAVKSRIKCGKRAHVWARSSVTFIHWRVRTVKSVSKLFRDQISFSKEINRS